MANSDFALQLDLEKRKIEARYVARFKRVFRNIASDSRAIYAATGSLPSESIADNYRGEFVVGVRDIYRDVTKKFAFDLRSSLEGKSYNFETDKWIKLFDQRIETKQTVTEEIESVESLINRDFLLDSTLFIANESEAQADMITQTNAKELQATENQAVLNFIAAQAVFQTRIDASQQEVNSLLADPQVTEAQVARQRAKTDKLQGQLEDLASRRNDLIGKEIQKITIDKSVARSELIASQNVGTAESWARQKEAELIAGSNLLADDGRVLRGRKEWVAIIDSSLRESHSVADGQVVGVNQSFIVQSERLKTPRDPRGSASNIMNCRCNAKYSFV